MKHCPQCELEFPDYFRFCGACGRAFTTSVRPPGAPQFRWWRRAIFGFVLLLLVGVIGIGAWYFWSPDGKVIQTSQQSNPAPGPKPTVSTAASFPPTSTSTPQPTTLDHSADDEITRLQEERLVTKPSASAEIFSALEQAERDYPADYRFPYELSKLSIKGFVAHHEAFEALGRAAEKAIDSGKADEMLNSLTADKDGDFYKLSHGHHEWNAIEQALRNNDKKLLKPRAAR